MNSTKGGRQTRLKASITVEAAVVLPIFLFGVLSILYINTLLLYEEEVRWALEQTAREASVEYAMTEKDITLNPAYFMIRMNQYVDADLNVSTLRSHFDEETQEIYLSADYGVQAPYPLVCAKTFFFTSRVRTRAFTGVESRAQGGENGDDIVYVTRTGEVYHRRLSCTYLSLSISQVKAKDLEYLRSDSGGKYYACEGCCGGMGVQDEEDVYICNYGNRYHRVRGCSKITRSIQQIKQSEAGERLPCSKCGQEE